MCRLCDNFFLAQEEVERVDEEDWLLQDVIFVEDSRNIPVGKVLKVGSWLFFPHRHPHMMSFNKKFWSCRSYLLVEKFCKVKPANILFAKTFFTPFCLRYRFKKAAHATDPDLMA